MVSISRDLFESIEYYEAKPYKAADDLIRVLRDADRVAERPAPESALRNAIEGLEGWELVDEAFLHSAFTVGDLRDVLNELEAARAALEGRDHG